jgi:hypothetical protein
MNYKPKMLLLIQFTKLKKMKTIKFLLFVMLIMVNNFLKAQSTGIIKGIISDKDGLPLYMANIRLYDDTLFITGVITDDKGNFKLSQLTPGDYNIEISYMGLITKKITKVKVDPFQIAYINTSLTPSDFTLHEAEVSATFEQTTLNPTFITMTSIRLEQIEKIPASPGDIIGIITALTPGVLPTDDGKDLYVRGSRRGSNLYIIDGNKVMGSADIPGMSISNMQVLTGGVPAEYGDCTGGVIIINTKDYKWEMRRKEMERRARAAKE